MMPPKGTSPVAHYDDSENRMSKHWASIFMNDTLRRADNTMPYPLLMRAQTPLNYPSFASWSNSEHNVASSGNSTNTQSNEHEGTYARTGTARLRCCAWKVCIHRSLFPDLFVQCLLRARETKTVVPHLLPLRRNFHPNR